MHNIFYALGLFASSLPCLAILAMLVHYKFCRERWRRKSRRGKKNAGFCPSASALGFALQFMQVFYRPSVSYVLEARQHDETEEETSGDPETLTKQLDRQLRRIRRGEPLERIILRL
jgi:hypothetical protein